MAKTYFRITEERLTSENFIAVRIRSIRKNNLLISDDWFKFKNLYYNKSHVSPPIRLSVRHN